MAGHTVYSKTMAIETVNKFRVITGWKTPLTRYHRAIQIIQCYVANNTSTHTHRHTHAHTHNTQITNIKTRHDVRDVNTIRIYS